MGMASSHKSMVFRGFRQTWHSSFVALSKGLLVTGAGPEAGFPCQRLGMY